MKYAFIKNAMPVTIMLTIVAVVLIGIFLFQFFRKKAAYKHGGVRYTPNGPVFDSNPTPFWKITQLWFAVTVFIAYLIALHANSSDWKPAKYYEVKPNTDGRHAAGDTIYFK